MTSNFQLVTSSYTDLQDYTYYFVPAPWLSVKLLRLLQYYPAPGLSSSYHCFPNFIHAMCLLQDMVVSASIVHGHMIRLEYDNAIYTMLCKSFVH